MVSIKRNESYYHIIRCISDMDTFFSCDSYYVGQQIFQWLQLSDMINSFTVSKTFRTILLAKECWYVISDHTKILNKFIRRVFKFELNMVPYPINVIQKMHAVDQSELLRVVPGCQEDLFIFYKYFPCYRYIYFDENYLAGCCNPELTVGLYICQSRISIPTLPCYTITEIIAPDSTISGNTLIDFYPRLEKLHINMCESIEQLKKTNIKYLHIDATIDIMLLINNLPKTIETLIITNGLHSSCLFDQLSNFPHLAYLRINLCLPVFITNLKINTLHLLIPSDLDKIVINVPSITHIIMSQKHTTTLFGKKKRISA